ncbi:MAG TPA: ABC transporter permease subunit [Anaerolineales bacterium]|nr:ABC transporter permease subunit [Anaerolineales bacterium]
MTSQTNSLQPVREAGWRSGLSNLVWKENSLRWGGRRWILPALIWLAIINGFILLIALVGDLDPSITPENVVPMAIGVFVSMGMFASSIGIVVNAQGAVIREKQLGTAAWVLSKPASRSAFIFAKWLAYSLASLVLSLALPALVFLVQSQLFWGKMPALVPFLGGWSIMLLHLQFYLALTLMLGTLFNARGAVIGISLAFMFSGSFLSLVLPSWISRIFPWPLQELAGGMAAGAPLPAGWQIPVIATALWIPLFIGIALWRFRREEF